MFITGYCRINSNSVSLNGKIIFQANEKSEDDFLKQVYRNLQGDYPKFFKMDVLSRAAFLGTEILKKNIPSIQTYKDDAIALLFANRVSSAATDQLFLDSYKKEASPSPALFVYTLPNILVGELAIRNKWYGENLFAIFPQFDAEHFTDLCGVMIPQKASACLCGWIDVIGQKNDTFLFFAEKNDSSGLNIPLNEESLQKLYNT